MGVVAGDDSRKPEAVLVTGMHASGTALIARGIALLQQALAPEPVAQENDRFPHVEHSSAVAALNQRILQEIGADSRRPSLLFLRGKSVDESKELIHGFVLACYLNQAVGVVSSGGAIGPMVLEDPGPCLFHDLWHAALQRAGYRVQTVLAARNPLEVAAALKTTQGLATSEALQAWVQHNLTVLTSALGHQGLTVVQYSDLLRPGAGLAGLLRTRLGWPAADATDATFAAEWPRLIDPIGQEASIPDQVVARSPLVPTLVKRLHALLLDWPARDSAARDAELAEMATAFEDQSLFAGNLLAVKLPELVQPVAPAVASSSETRKLLIHYHLFKNAGTSVDAILRHNFGHRWVNTELPPPNEVDHQEAIRRLILDNPNLAAISSHTLMMPVPEIEGVEILPILFVRHPLDRLKSAYEFERTQNAATVGTELAKVRDFAGYILARLAMPGDRACRDFQVYRLAMAVPSGEGAELERALIALDRLPFVGLVEAFGASVEALQGRVRAMVPGFESFDVRANITAARPENLEERLEEITLELGEETLAMVMAANAADMAIYQRIRQMYAKKLERTPSMAVHV